MKPVNPKDPSLIQYSPGWTGDIKITYVEKEVEYTDYTAEDRIEESSVFSLTRKGLIVNSGGSSRKEGYVKISTENPEVSCYDENNKTRVKLGYLRSEKADNIFKDIYGLDIYDGCIAIYESPYGTPENDKILYTERNGDRVVLKIKGDITTDGGSIGGWHISGNSLWTNEATVDSILNKFELYQVSLNSEYYTDKPTSFIKATGLTAFKYRTFFDLGVIPDNNEQLYPKLVLGGYYQFVDPDPDSGEYNTALPRYSFSHKGYVEQTDDGYPVIDEDDLRIEVNSWYSHLFQNFPICCGPHSQRLWHSQ